MVAHVTGMAEEIFITTEVAGENRDRVGNQLVLLCDSVASVVKIGLPNFRP